MAPSRGIIILRSRPFACLRCHVRSFSTSAPLPSGHNRWSKIKHDKAKADASKNRQRSVFAQEIATASKLFGPDPSLNPKLADAITKAKREGFAKNSIEAAIARGQGKSASGASLENVTVEGMFPGGVGVVIECETDSRLRTLMDVRLMLKEADGRETASAYLFGKRGRINFEPKEGIGAEDALDAALEAGATDVDQDEDGAVVVFCEPGDTTSVGEAVSSSLGLDVKTSEILWSPNEDTKVHLADREAAEALGAFVDELQEKDSTVQAVAMNVAQGSLDADTWRGLQSRLSC